LRRSGQAALGRDGDKRFDLLETRHGRTSPKTIGSAIMYQKVKNKMTSRLFF
jgi:hypothetical protein